MAQEIREDAFDEVRRRRNPEYPDIASPQHLCAFSQRTGAVEKAVAIAEELLAFAREHDPPSDAVEELDAELVLETGNMARERWLRHVQLLRGL